MFNRESLPLHSIFLHSCIAAVVFSFLTCYHQSFSHRRASPRDAYYLPGYYCVLVLLYSLTLLPLPLLQRTLGGNSSLQFTFCGTLLDWFRLQPKPVLHCREKGSVREKLSPRSFLICKERLEATLSLQEQCLV